MFEVQSIAIELPDAGCGNDYAWWVPRLDDVQGEKERLAERLALSSVRSQKTFLMCV